MNPATDRAWQQFLDVLTGQASSTCCPTLDELQISPKESKDMTEAEQLLAVFERFTREQRKATRDQFEELAIKYPHKCFHTAGYTDLWLTAISGVLTGRNPWL